MDVQTGFRKICPSSMRYTVLLLVMFGKSSFATEVCGGTFTGLSGTFVSPNYSSSYSNNQNCNYSVSVPPNYRITLHFVTFSLQPSDSTLGCLDYVDILFENSTSAPRYSRYCGSQLQNRRIRSTQNQIHVWFHSDNQNTYTGFRVVYSTDTLGDQIVLVASESIIWRTDLLTISTAHRIPVTDLRNIEFDFLQRRVLWTGREDAKIYSVLLNDTVSKDIIDLGEGAALSDIAFDAPTGLLFYLDSGNDAIGVVNASGDAHKRILTTDLNEQSKITVDTVSRKIYWTENNTLKSASYDGTNNRTLLTVNEGRTLLSATVDSRNAKVYVLESGHDPATIHILDSNGGQISPHFTVDQANRTTTRIIHYDQRIYYINVVKNRADRVCDVKYITPNGSHFNLLIHSSKACEDLAFYSETIVHQKMSITTTLDDSKYVQSTTVTSQTASEMPQTVKPFDNEMSITTTLDDSKYVQSTTVTSQTASEMPQTVKPFDNEASANSADGLDNKLVIVGGALGAFTFLLIVVLVIVVVILVKRKGRGKDAPMSLNEINARSNSNVYLAGTTPAHKVEEVHDNPGGPCTVPDDDYVLPVPALPPRGNTNWSNGGDDNDDYMTLT